MGMWIGLEMVTNGDGEELEGGSDRERVKEIGRLEIRKLCEGKYVI